MCHKNQVILSACSQPSTNQRNIERLGHSATHLFVMELWSTLEMPFREATTRLTFISKASGKVRRRETSETTTADDAAQRGVPHSEANQISTQLERPADEAECRKCQMKGLLCCVLIIKAVMCTDDREGTARPIVGALEPDACLPPPHTPRTRERLGTSWAWLRFMCGNVSV